MFARPFIDSIDFAKNGRELCGEIPVAALSRLHDTLANSDGILRYAIRGYKQDDRYFLEVVLKGECHLLCQRCLAEFSYPLDMTSRLQLLSAEQLSETESDDSDEMESIEAATQLDVLSLIEDEVLLGMPFAPKHPEGVCNPAMDGSLESANPFAMLANLKVKQS